MLHDCTARLSELADVPSYDKPCSTCFQKVRHVTCLTVSLLPAAVVLSQGCHDAAATADDKDEEEASSQLRNCEHWSRLASTIPTSAVH